jgi:hypothetical protein
MRNAGNDGLEDRRPAIHNNNNNMWLLSPPCFHLSLPTFAAKSL